MGVVRFATIGTSGICERFLEALEEVEGAECVATYSRSLDRVRSFGERYGARLFFDDLEELARCADVDAVYVASPNGLHAAQAAGEHEHVQRVGVQRLQGAVGGDGDTVGAGDLRPADARQTDLHAGPAQQIGGHQGLALLKSRSQQNGYHVATAPFPFLS